MGARVVIRVGPIIVLLGTGLVRDGSELLQCRNRNGSVPLAAAAVGELNIGSGGWSNFSLVVGVLYDRFNVLVASFSYGGQFGESLQVL